MSIFCLSSSSDLMEIIPNLVYLTNGSSIFGSIMVLLLYILLPKLRKHWFMRYLAYLNISNLCVGVTSMLLSFDIFINQIIPQNQSFISIYVVFFSFRYSSFIWPLIVVVNLYQIIVAKRSNNLSHYELFWLVIGFVIPIIVVFILSCFGLIQFKQNLTLIIIEFIIPIIFLEFFTLLTIIKFAKAAQFAFGNEEAKKIIGMILPYSLAAIVISIPACAFNIIYSFDGCFTFSSGLFLSLRGLQGAFDAIVFSFNPNVREEMRKYFRNSDETINLIL